MGALTVFSFSYIPWLHLRTFNALFIDLLFNLVCRATIICLGVSYVSVARISITLKLNLCPLVSIACLYIPIFCSLLFTYCMCPPTLLPCSSALSKINALTFSVYHLVYNIFFYFPVSVCSYSNKFYLIFNLKCY